MKKEELTIPINYNDYKNLKTALFYSGICLFLANDFISLDNEMLKNTISLLSSTSIYHHELFKRD